MQYTISASEQGDFVQVNLHNDFDRPLAKEFTKEAKILAQDKQLNKVLVDIRGYRSKASLGEMYRYVQERSLDNNWQTALLVDEIDLSIEFLENSMVEAGHNYKVFTCEEQAKNWLGNENKAGTKSFKLNQTCLPL